jgi:hypothetical protein
MTDATVMALPVTARAGAKDRTGAERQRRFRAKKRAVKTTQSTGAALAPVTTAVGRSASQRNGAVIDFAAYVAAIALAGAAAWFSVRGMVCCSRALPYP